MDIILHVYFRPHRWKPRQISPLVVFLIILGQIKAGFSFLCASIAGQGEPD